MSKAKEAVRRYIESIDKSDLDRHIERLMHDEEIKIYFDKANGRRLIAQQFASMRKASHFTQSELAKKARTKQQVISRLENPSEKRMPTLEFLDKVARVFDKRLVICLE